MTNLGMLMQQAGVKGAKRGPMTVEAARLLAHKKVLPTSSGVAMSRLPEDFNDLLVVKDGKEFLRVLSKILDENNRAELTVHTVRGLVQLVHHHHDSSQGSRRTSYNRAIAILQGVKAKAEKNPTQDMRGFLLKRISAE